MTTDELIRVLRDRADQILEWDAKQYAMDGKMMKEAADRLEELDERNAILMSNMDNAWGNNYS